MSGYGHCRMPSRRSCIVLCVIGVLALAPLTSAAAQGAAPGGGVLDQRPLSALCGGDPDIVRYYQRERRAVWRELEPLIGSILTPLQELDAKDAFTPDDRKTAGRLAQRLTAVRSALDRLVPTLADDDDAVFLAALDRAAATDADADAESVYAVFDRILVSDVIAQPPMADSLSLFIERIALLRHQLQRVEGGRESRAAYLRASARLRDAYQRQLQPALGSLLDTTVGLQRLQDATSSWCAGNPRLPALEALSGRLLALVAANKFSTAVATDTVNAAGAAVAGCCGSQVRWFGSQRVTGA